jgi:hypothetical protein
MNLYILSFSDDQKEAIQEYINKLRIAVVSNEWENEEHSQRMLDKVNELQAEFNRKVGNYYKRLGMWIAFGDAVGKGSRPIIKALKDGTDALRLFKNDSLQIRKPDKPLQIEDRSEEDDEK